jgi:GntR family phosphonate transport system transcriptional regulator
MIWSNDVSMTTPLPRGAALAREDGVAAWRRIADAIEADIVSGTAAPGGQLPPEAQLAGRFGVNRHTVRRALGVLAARGLVRATQGRGTFVEVPPLAYPISTRTRFSEAVSRAGREAGGELIEAAQEAAGQRVADALGIPPGAPVLRMVTRHKADGTPISVARTTLPLPRFAGLDETYRAIGSLTRAYAAHGVADFTRLSTRITARTAGAREARWLELDPGRVVLVIDSVNIDPERRPIQVTRAHFAADRVELVIES